MTNVFKSNRKLGYLGFSFQVFDPSHWRNDTSRQATFKVHQSTETIFFRFRDQIADNRLAKGSDSLLIKDYPLMPLYKGQIDRYLNALSRFYIFNDFCAIAARLLPNGIIPMHKDQGNYFTSSYRIHIPIKTSLKSIFMIDDSKVHMELGCAYEIDNVSCPHGVQNLSNEPRDHLIFDLFP